MRKTFKLLCALSVLFFVGCEEQFLETEPKGSPTSSTFWKTEQDVISAKNALYLMNDFQGIYGRGIYLYSLIASDDFVVGKSKTQIEDIKNFVTTGSGSYTRDIWPMHYQVIKRANDIINNVMDVEDASEEVKNVALGEAYFMRGLAYYQLSVLYGHAGPNGGIPIVDENTIDFFIERPESVITSYMFAIDNFIKAADLLPPFSDLPTEDYGRAHKNAALGYLVRTHLYLAKYDSSSWQKVITAADRLLQIQSELEPNFEDIFDVQNTFGKDYIWSVPSNTQGGSILPGASLENKGWGLYNGWGYFAPTLDLYESFEEGDLRREATLLVFGDTFTFFGDERRFWSTRSLTGIQLKKYLDPYSYAEGKFLNGNGDHPTTELDPYLLRLSDIYLMKAEAKIMLNQNADNEINIVRTRAGLPNLVNATLEDLKKERRSEFAGEMAAAGRFEDLVRWGDFDELRKPVMGRLHEDKENPDSPFEIYEVWPQRTFNEEKSIVWPIPPQVIDQSRGTLLQNPNY